MSHVSRARQWARVHPPGAASLRRGAWYPVVNAGAPNRVFVDVGIRHLVVHRDLVEIRSDRPGSFSLVHRLPTERNPTSGTSEDLGLTYAVCPESRSRVRLTGHPSHLRCPDCGFKGVVEWDTPC